MREILETIVGDFLDAFLNAYLKNAGKEFNEAERRAREIDSRIFSNIWLKDILEALQLLDFNLVPLANLTDLFLEFVHKICENPMNDILVSRAEFQIKCELAYYPPRSALIEALKYDSRKNSSIEKFVTDYRVLNCKNKNNIGFFRILLELEDLEELQEYVQYVQESVYIITHGTEEFHFTPQGKINSIESIVTPNMDEVVIVPNAQFVFTKLNCIKGMLHMCDVACRMLSATITAVSKTAITCEFKEPKDNLMPGNPYVVIFRPTRQAVRYQNRALDLLSEEQDIYNYLFPTYGRNPVHPQQEIPQIKFINEEIGKNPEQSKAVITIVLGPNPCVPFIVFGPPGTGKTSTIVESILQLRLRKPESRILIAAGSNSACDTIAARLCDWEKNEFYQEHLAKTTAYPMLRIFSKEIVKRGTTNLSEVLAYRSNVAWNQGKLACPAIEDIHKYGIVVTTLCTVGKLVSGDVNKENYFTHVFIDEAGSSSVPEALMGIMGIKNNGKKSCCVILSGDHKQLGPVIKSKIGEKHGLGVSLMEHLLKSESYTVNENGDYDCSVQARLVRNYRSHPEIVKLYNHLFYNNELIAMNNETNIKNKSKWSFLPNPQYPIAFQVVNGDMSKKGTKSSSNLLEIDACMACIQMLVENHGVQENDIGIITPYSLQSNLIKKRLNDENLQGIEVGSVERFQGREKLIILASMVRSDSNLGFVKCPRRINVLLSRPISLLIIFGDPNTLEGSTDLKHVIENCKKMGNYLNATNNGFGLKDNTFTIGTNKKTCFTQRRNRILNKSNWRL